MKLFRRSIDKEKGESEGIRAKLCIVTVLSVLVLVAAVPMAAGGWYFKAGYPSYAPSGMPDFDQKQDAWQRINCGLNGTLDTPVVGDDLVVGIPWPYQQWIVPGPDCTLDSGPVQGDDFLQWSFCGPTAVANCFWWFDSKYADPKGTPGDGNDICPLVQDYGVGDDHLAANVPLLISQLASNMSTCMNGTTNVYCMQNAIAWWLNNTGLNTTLYEHTVEAPEFEYIEEEIEKSQDVILLLGYWSEYPPGSGNFYRCGGHYVTCAGVNSEEFKIALSDPYFDNAVGGPGRIVPNPHPPSYSSTYHNDAKNISHDYYDVVPSISPGGFLALPGYPVSLNPGLVGNFQENECPPEGEIHTEIEYAVIVSPILDVNKTVWNGEDWVEEVAANIYDTVRFKLWVHNTGIQSLTNIVVRDIMSDSLDYSDNATHPEDQIIHNPDGTTTVYWNFTGPLAPCQNITIEFDATVVKCPGVDTNTMNVTALYGSMLVSAEDSANVAVMPTPFLIYGWVKYINGTAVLDPNVTIRNLNTSEVFTATKNASYNYYQLITSSCNVSAGNVLRFNASDNGNSVEFDVPVTGKNMTDGGLFGLNLTIPAAFGPSDLVISDVWVCWPDNCTLCYNVTNIGEANATAGHNATLHVDSMEKAHDLVPVELGPDESYIGCFNYTWTYTPTKDNITVCADNNKTIGESNESNNCLTEEWMCGDVTGDNSITSLDYVTIRAYKLGKPGWSIKTSLWAADVTGDNSITSLDYVTVRAYKLGKPGWDLNCCCKA
jgi:uncharacterized repeat protein (TIGR01451 family)